MVLRVDKDSFDKMAPQRVKTAPGATEFNRSFGAETDILNLQRNYCLFPVNSEETSDIGNVIIPVQLLIRHCYHPLH